MGRTLLLIGIGLIIVGTVMPFFTTFNTLSNVFDDIAPALEMATNPDVQAAELCGAGERLETENGASEYTIGSGYSSTVRFFCINREGQRREVTTEFVESIFGDAFGVGDSDGDGIADGVADSFGEFGGTFGTMASDIFTGLGQGFLSMALIILGVLFTILGAIMTSRRRRSAYAGVNVIGGTAPVSIGSASPDWLSSLEQSAGKAKRASGQKDVTERLKQLEDLYQNNLISREEYEESRQKILNEL